MKPFFALISGLFSLFVLQSCVDVNFDNCGSEEKNNSHNSLLFTKSSAGIFYHEETGFLIQEQDDPFLVKPGENATHRAIEFRPQSKEDYDYLFSFSDDVLFSYIPFGYTTIRTASTDDRGQYQSFPTGERFYCSTDQCEEILPIVYSTWPIDLSVPEGLEHTVLGDLNLPLKDNADTCPSRFDGQSQINLPITVDTYDSLLGTYVPMTGIKVRVVYGSFYCDYAINSNGSTIIRPHMFSIDLTLSEINQLQVYVIYQTPDFIVSRNTALNPIQKYLGTVASLWGMMSYNISNYSTYVSHQTSQTNECDIFQAAYYYFNGSHAFSNYIVSSERDITIHASTDTPQGKSAETNFPGGDPTITVYDGSFPNKEWIGIVLHEFGHVHHYCINNQYSSVDSLVRESFGCYTGWSIGGDYYFSKGFVLPFAGYPINLEGSQDWTQSSEDINYSPLFVDLTDDYNQPCLNDPISGVPASIINSIIATALSVSGCKSYLDSYAGTYFTSTELNSYFAYYL